VKALRSLMIASLLTVATSAVAQDPSPYKFEFHGFVTGSLYMQDQIFSGNVGQGLLFFAPTPGNAAPCKTPACTSGTFAAGTATKSGTLVGGDVRQSRYIFALSGPQVFAGATPKAYFEGDLFGPGPAGILTESWVWRIRAAYAQLNWANASIAAGQFSANTAFAQMPDSVSHIANPLSFGAGNYGWRQMGFRGAYTIPMEGMKLTLTATVAGAKSFNDGALGPASPAAASFALASGMPGLELNANLEGKAGSFGYRVYADAYYQSADLKGFGKTNPNGVTLPDASVKTSTTSNAYEIGGKFTFAPVYLAFNFYSGQGLGQWAGSLLQMGEVKDMGYWASLGANLTKEFSLNATYGAGLPDKKDVLKWAVAAGTAAPKSENTLIAGQAKYMDGGYAFALEYISYATKYLYGPTNAVATWADRNNTHTITTNAYQIILTGAYFF